MPRMLFALALLVPLAALAESPAERTARWRAALVSPCCWTESLETHGSAAAIQAREELDSLIQAGSSDGEIRAFFLDAYGAAVFAVPDGQRAVWLFTAPAVAALVGLVIAILLLMKLRRAAIAAGPGAHGPLYPVDDADLGW